MTRGFETEFQTEREKIIQRLCRYLEELKDVQYVSVSDSARDVRVPPHILFAIFEEHNIRVADFSEPTLYRVADILESLVRQEVSARFNRS